jgi:hypothetical protein
MLWLKDVMKNYFIVKIITLAFLAGFLAPLWAAEPNNKAIEMKFFKCEKSQDLRGGIYGKGPFKKFGPPKSECSEDEWVEISKDEFKTLASRWYRYDWTNEIPFWKEP